MHKLRMAFFAVVGVLMAAMPALAQAGQVAADNESSVAKYAKPGRRFRFRDCGGFWAQSGSRAWRRRRRKARRVIRGRAAASRF